MPSILQNVTAMAASRQIGITQQGLRRAIERLTTGKRVNRASDDAAGMSLGTLAEASARYSNGAVKANFATFYQAQAADSYMEEATNLAYRLAELEGSGNTASAEYTAVQSLVAVAYSLAVAGASAVGVTLTAYVTANSTSSITQINTSRVSLAATMATANSQANINGITSENQFSISDNWLGADIGSETVAMTKYQILMQAGNSALTQANQSAQSVLALFR